MRYDLIPQGPLEAAALMLGMVPTPLADTLVAIWLARSIMTATKLGVFEVLADGPLAPDEVAARSGTDPGATAKLLGALVPTGYLRWEPDEVASEQAPADCPAQPRSPRSGHDAQPNLDAEAGTGDSAA